MSKWWKENKQSKALKYILFLILPLVSFIYSLRRINTRSSYRIFFWMALLFGTSFTVQSGKTLEVMFDSASYRERFEEWVFMTEQHYIEGLEGFLTFDEGKKDYFFETVAYLLTRFTDNYHYLFLVVAFIFARYALKTFRFLTSDVYFDTSVASYILAYLFMSNQIFNINGVRMWTAAWIGVYALFQIFRNGRNGYFLLIFLTPFFHGSFWIFIAVVLLAFFLKRFDRIWAILFFISFFVGNLSLEILRDVSDQLPVFAQRMIQSYTDPERVAQIREGGTGFYWVSRMMSILVRIYMNYMVYLFIKNSTSIKANFKSKELYLFLLVFMTFVNFTMPVPSLGGRYMTLAYPIIAYIWLVNFKGRKYIRYLYLMPFVFWFSIYRRLNQYFSVLEPAFFISNPFWLIYKYLIA